MVSNGDINALFNLLREAHARQEGVKDPELDSLTRDVNQQIEHSQEVCNKISEGMLALSVDTTVPAHWKWLQAHLVGTTAAVIGTYELNKAIYEELVEANQTLDSIHTHLAHAFPLPEDNPNTSEQPDEVPADVFSDGSVAFNDLPQDNTEAE